MRRVLHVVGARPNFVKAASLIAALRDQTGIEQQLLHTGQHIDAAMSGVFFEALGLPAPDHELRVGGGSHAAQTAAVMLGVERVLTADRPDLVVVVGDVNSTLAAALVAAKMGVPIAHVEAGLRSFDRSMPEEINRVLVDQLATLNLAPCREAGDQLRREGIREDAVAVVGDLAIDTLLAHRHRASWNDVGPALGLERRKYGVLTLHRPATVDSESRLRALVARLRAVAARLPLVCPVHPRTAQRLAAAGLELAADRLRVIDPLGYHAFVALMDHAACVLTDSGGIQAETTALDVPCFTLRDNTERPFTISEGTNTLVMADGRLLPDAVDDCLHGGGKRGSCPALWDGQAGRRSARAIAALLASPAVGARETTAVPS
jgi:UDP-N-acetylglucosamine 2-epimerase (non-hydrolysing)